MNRKVVYFLAALLAVLAVLSYRLAAPFLGPCVFAALVAIAVRPVYVRMESLIRRPGTAAGFTTLLAFLLILLPAGFVVLTISKEVTALYHELESKSAASGGVRIFVLEKMDQLVRWAAGMIGVAAPDLAGMARERLEGISQWLLLGVATVVRGIGVTIVNALLSAVILFFFLRDGERIRDAVADLLPLTRQDCDELSRIIANTVKANFYGVLGVASAQGVLTGIGWAIAGLSSPFTWGAIAAIASMIPVAGPALVWAPGALTLLGTGSSGRAAFLALWGVLVVGMADNVLRPMLVMEKTKQHPLLVLLSLIGGVSTFGLMGLFLGPLIVSVLIAVIGLLRREMAEGGH
jgi:predicted PurR-regulated permease PerM